MTTKQFLETLTTKTLFVIHDEVRKDIVNHVVPENQLDKASRIRDDIVDIYTERTGFEKVNQ